MKKTNIFIRLLLLIAALFMVAISVYHEDDYVATYYEDADCVVLLHGLGRTSTSMNGLAEYLNENGFNIYNFGYPSQKYDIHTLSIDYFGEYVSDVCKGQELHIVTHSLGGILVRYYLQDHEIDNLGRIVMLAPPNQGSEYADSVQTFPFSKSIIGPALFELGTDSNGVPLAIDSADADIAIIAGSKDKKVSTESAMLDDSSAFLVVDTAHTFIMNNDYVRAAVLRYLMFGQFSS